MPWTCTIWVHSFQGYNFVVLTVICHPQNFILKFHNKYLACGNCTARYIHTSGYVWHLQRMMSRFDHTSCSQWGSPRSSLWSGCTLIWANHAYPKAILLHQIQHYWSNNHTRYIIYNEILDGQVILKNRIAKMMNLWYP